MNSNTVLIVFTLFAAGIFFYPRLLRSSGWRATVTPLASIIGSGFLIVGPILSETFGDSAWIAMLLLCAIGYLYGAAIRYNIRYVEPDLAQLTGLPSLLERSSHAALSVSYFISVAYYLNLFSAFGLRVFGVDDRTSVQIVATLVIAATGLIGLKGGLRALERLEVGAVGIKLAVIIGLLASLVIFASDPRNIWRSGEANPGIESLQILLGLVILVQGFETSRYLGSEYQAEMRIRTMRYAQWISTAIYLSFVFLLTHLFQDGVRQSGGETVIIDMLHPLGGAVVPLLIIAALASQSSASIADMNGASGLLFETTRGRLSVNTGNFTTALVAIAVTWSGNIYTIITYASKAFVIYYGLQSLQAVLSALRRQHPYDACLFTAGVILAILVVMFGVPVAA